MHRAESREQSAKGNGGGFDQRRTKSLCPIPCILCSGLLILCSLLLFLCGCSAFSPPDDYYKEVLEMEEHGEQERKETGRQPGETLLPDSYPEPIAVEKRPAEELPQEEVQQDIEEVSVIEQQEVEIQEEPPRREPIEKPPPSQKLSSEPVSVAIASEVIKSALNNANLGLNIRTVELVNGRPGGGKNSVRVSFLSESLDVIDDKFVVVGMAEDNQANLLAIVQSNMISITAWMTNEISKSDWFSEVTKKVL